MDDPSNWRVAAETISQIVERMDPAHGTPHNVDPQPEIVLQRQRKSMEGQRWELSLLHYYTRDSLPPNSQLRGGC